MSDPTFVLRHYHDDCTSLNLSLTDQVSGMEANSICSLYSDLRSSSRARRQHLRQRRFSLDPVFRSKHCHRDCLAYKHRHLSSRHRRTRRIQAECTDAGYWDKECAELEHEERLAYSDLVAWYYNHGHNAAAIESLRPTQSDFTKEEAVGAVDAHDWVCVSAETNLDALVKIVTTPSWALYLYPPLTALGHEDPTSSASTPSAPRSPDPHPPSPTDLCVWPETTFTWHRNASGIWVLGYANQDLLDAAKDPHGCTQNPLALECGCCSFNAGYHACSCISFPPWWRSPEENWRGSIAAWISGEVWDAMECADALQRLRQRGWVSEWPGLDGQDGEDGVAKDSVGLDGAEEWTFVRAAGAPQRGVEEWDLVSGLSSTGSWRLVDVT